MSEIATTTEKTLKTRIKMKYLSTEDQANTEKTSATLLQGELAIYGGDKPKMKVGDGEATIADLPFIGSDGDLTVDLEEAADGVTGYLKPQNPLRKESNYIYPLTTYDQVILPDDTRWDGAIINQSVVDEMIESKVITKSHNINVPVNNWQSNEYFFNEVNIEDIKSTDSPIIDLDLSQAEISQISSIKRNWTLIDRCITSDGKLTFISYADTPTIDLPVIVKVISNMVDRNMAYAEGVSF